MGSSLALLAIVVEIAFAAYCIFTKSKQSKTRNILRIAAFAGFVLLALMQIIVWSTRYYALFALLLLLAAIGAIGLLRTPRDEKPYTPARVILKAIGMTLLLLAAILPVIIFPPYDMIATTGEHPVATATYTYTDATRIETFTNTDEHRSINVQLWYPEISAGEYPLLVFSHGAIATKSSNESLYNELASHGYVVASIDHPYHSLSTRAEDGRTTWIDLGYLNDLSTQDAHSRKQQAYEFFQEWMRVRMGDIDLAIDHILAEATNSAADPVYARVDPTKIGVMGHSLGGSAALGIGRTRDDVGAVLALESPFMYDIEGVEAEEFIFTEAVYPVPVLNVYSTTWSHLGEWAQYAQNYRLLADTEATAFNVYISEAGHLSLTDLALASPILTRIMDGKDSSADADTILKTINRLSVEFFDAFLKGKGEFTAAGAK